MTVSLVFRRISLLATFAALAWLASCGAEAPTYEPGDIFVDSAPPGANILLDGSDTGQVTPFTFTDQPPGSYVFSVILKDFVPDREMKLVDLSPAEKDSVHFTMSQTGFSIASPAGARILVDGTDTGKVVPASVAGLDPGSVMVSLQLDGYFISPAESEILIVDKMITEIPDDRFYARARKTVILEGFANTSCTPCPQLTDNLLAMTAKPDFSPDRVQFIEFAVSWPQLGDPFFIANPEGNSERYNLYHVGQAPDLYVDGIRQVDALDAAAMEAAVAAAMQEDPGFLVDVEAVFSNSPVPAVVTLTALRDVDLTGHAVYVALYEKEVVIEPAPGVNGQTHFHHVFRERSGYVPLSGVLTVDEPIEMFVNLGSHDSGPDSYIVVAYVQNQSSLAVLQCGSTVLQTQERKSR